MKDKMYYIQNKGYSGNALIWWAKDSKGYTTDIRKAGKYTGDQIKNKKREEDIFWPCDYIDNLLEAQKLIIDMQYLDSKKALYNTGL